MSSQSSDETALRILSRLAAKFRPSPHAAKSFNNGRYKTFSLYGDAEQPDDEAEELKRHFGKR